MRRSFLFGSTTVNLIFTSLGFNNFSLTDNDKKILFYSIVKPSRSRRRKWRSHLPDRFDADPVLGGLCISAGETTLHSLCSTRFSLLQESPSVAVSPNHRVIDGLILVGDSSRLKFSLKLWSPSNHHAHWRGDYQISQARPELITTITYDHLRSPLSLWSVPDLHYLRSPTITTLLNSSLRSLVLRTLQLSTS